MAEREKKILTKKGLLHIGEVVSLVAVCFFIQEQFGLTREQVVLLVSAESGAAATVWAGSLINKYIYREVYKNKRGSHESTVYRKQKTAER